MRAISQEIPQSSITKFSLKINYLEFCGNLPGANELNHDLNQSWVITNQVFINIFQWDLMWNSYTLFQEHSFEKKSSAQYQPFCSGLNYLNAAQVRRTESKLSFIDLGQVWTVRHQAITWANVALSAIRQHQAITWTNIDLSAVRPIHPLA